MTVYVDDMFKHAMGMFKRGGRVYKMSHMIADTNEELHEMADKIGIARRFHQGDHYDICLSKRRLAVEAGAVEISMRELANKCFAARRKA